MDEQQLSPLSKTLYLRHIVFGCVTTINAGRMETAVFEGNKIVTLRGSDGHKGLALGQRHTLCWLPGRSSEGAPVVRLRAPVWDPFTGSMYGHLFPGQAIVRLLDNASAVAVAGSVGQAGCQEGPGAAARFTYPNCLTTDGQGALYCVDINHVWKLALPAAWKKAHHNNCQPACVAAAVAAAAAAPEERRQAHAAGEGFQGREPQEQMQGQNQDQVQVSILPFGPRALEYYFVAYNPLRQALILASECAVYQRALTEGAPEEPVLLAGCEEEVGDGDGTGTNARFCSIEGLVVDGAGATLVLDSYSDPEMTAVRRVGPDGKVTTLARDLPGVWHAPAILPNGYLALCDGRTDSEDGLASQLLVLDLGLTPNACHAAAPSPPPAGPKPHTLPSDLTALLASTSQPGGGSADVVVAVGDREFRAHSAMLSARSAYFRQRLDPGTGFGEAAQQRHQEQQQQQQHLSLPDASPDAFELVLRYMYTDSVGDIPGALLQPAAELADRLLLPGLCEEAGRQMLAAVCAESVVGLLLWAEQRCASFGELLRGLKAWFGEHREEVVALPEHTKRLWAQAQDLAYELFFDAAGGGSAKRQRVQ